MKPHIQATIEDLRAERTRLDYMITFLSGLGATACDPAFSRAPAGPYLLDTALEQHEAATEVGRAVPARRDSAKPQVAKLRKPARNGSAAKPANGSAKFSADSVVAAIATIPMPFKADQVEQAAHITHKQAQDTLWRWKTKGWVKSVGFGTYERTAKFPLKPIAANAEPRRDLKPAAPQPPSKGRDFTEPSTVPAVDILRTRLAEAKKNLDSAKANGRTTLVDMFTQDIERLENQIAALS